MVDAFATTVTSLLYVSTSTLDRAEAAAAVKAIIAGSHQFNPPHDLTGALLFTGTHFAQVLEGSDAEIDRLMTAIANDPRHRDIIVVDRRPIMRRRFPTWSMAYLGPSQFVSRHVTRLMHDPAPLERRRAAEWLTQLLREFVKT